MLQTHSTRQLTEAEFLGRVGVVGVNLDSLTFLKGLSRLPVRSDWSLNNLEAAPMEVFIKTTSVSPPKTACFLQRND